MTKYDDDVRDDELLDVVRETVQQLERLTKRLQSFIETTEENNRD